MSGDVDPGEFAWRLRQATPRPWVTSTLIAVNVAVWLATVVVGEMSPIAPNALDLLRWGGNHRPYTLAEPWRLLTATVLHGGIIHLGFNMWVLRDIGRIAERFYGSLQMLLIYLASGLFGSLASLFFAARAGVSIGASGAIFGIVGCLLAALFTKGDKLPRGLAASMRSSMLVFVGYSLAMGFLAGFIDNAAHLGGLASGFLLGVILAERFDVVEFRRQAITRAAVAVLVSGAAVLGIWRMLPTAAT